jgi:hypothetical protein
VDPLGGPGTGAGQPGQLQPAVPLHYEQSHYGFAIATSGVMTWPARKV